MYLRNSYTACNTIHLNNKHELQLFCKIKSQVDGNKMKIFQILTTDNGEQRYQNHVRR